MVAKPNRNTPLRRVLTIAGSDSGGGAGIEADLKTFLAFGVHGMAAITAVTAQNTQSVSRIDPVPAAGVAAQIDAVLDDIGADAIKTGMLGDARIARAVARALRAHPEIPLVIDPVMVSTSGSLLLPPSGRRALIGELFPLARLVTPNLYEAEAILEAPVGIGSRSAALSACRAIADLGPAAVLLKGGHGRGATIRDWLYSDGQLDLYSHPRRRTKSTHGTGCTLSAAIAALIALRHGLPDAVFRAIQYVDGAIRAARPLGRGAGPLAHGWNLHAAAPALESPRRR